MFCKLVSLLILLNKGMTDVKTSTANNIPVDLKLSEIASVSGVSSNIMCMLLCLGTMGCSYYALHTTLEQCSLFNTALTNVSGPYGSGWMYYHIKENVDVRCPEHSTIHGKECFVLVETPDITWHAAQDICRTLYGGYLAEPQSHESIAGTIALFAESTNETTCWLGGTFESSGWHFVWNSTGEFVGGTSWIIGRPSYLPGQDCMVLMKESSVQTGWFDVDCNVKQKCFICENGL